MNLQNGHNRLRVLEVGQATPFVPVKQVKGRTDAFRGQCCSVGA